MPQRIVLELQTLAAETRRKYPDVRQVSEHLLAQWQADPERTVAELQACKDPGQNAFLQMIVVACGTRSPKVIQMALSLLQRSIPLRILPDSALDDVINTLHALLSAPGRADVDVQLKILQTVSTLLATYAAVTAKLLSRALMLCFALYEHSRVAVVSSTAAAMLRQCIMIVFDKVHEEDRLFDAIQSEDAAARAPVPAHTAQLPNGPVTLFPCAADAYHLLNDLCALADGQPAQFLPLSMLSKPFVLELLESVLTSQASLFAVGRHPELVYILRSSACPFLLKALSEPPLSFSVYIRIVRLVCLLLHEFSEEVRLEVEMLLRALLHTLDEKHALWQRVLAWETVRILCSDTALIERLWDWFDARHRTDEKAATRVLAQLVMCVQHGAQKVQASLMIDNALAAALEHRPDVSHTPTNRGSQTLYDAAVAGVRSAAEGLLSSRQDVLSGDGCEPAIPLLDQLDKTEVPVVGSAILPTTYQPYLVFQSLVHLAHGLAVLPAAKLAPVLSTFVRPLNEGLTAFISVQGDDAFYEKTLQALVDITIAAGNANCNSERDLILVTLCNIAVPSTAYSTQALAPRNLAAQAALAYVCAALGTKLGQRWHALLQCVCQALLCLCKSDDEEVSSPADTPWSLQPFSLTSSDVQPWLTHSNMQELPRILRGVFVTAASLDDAGLFTFADVFVKLAIDRACEAHESNTLPHIMLVELERFVHAAAPQIAAHMPHGPWASLLKLTTLFQDERVVPKRRIDTAHTWDACLYAVWCALPTDAHAKQQDVLEVLANQGMLGRQMTSSSHITIRLAALQTMYRILESHAHIVNSGWSHVFAMCEAAAHDAADIRAGGAVPAPLLRTAFTCMQLVCTSHLNVLSDTDLERCIHVVPSFSMQTEDVGMALQANGTLWDLTESIERRKKTQAFALWLALLMRLRDVAQVPQANVAECALANLFQVLLQYHMSFSDDDWPKVLTEVLLPLVEATNAPALAFQGTARVIRMVPALRSDQAWQSMWRRWLSAVEHAIESPGASQHVVHITIEALHSVVCLNADDSAWWLETWPTILRLCEANVTALPDLGLLVDMLHRLFVCLPCTDTHILEMLHALHMTMQRGLDAADALSLAHLQTLVKHVQTSFDFMAKHNQARLPVLEGLQRCVDMAHTSATHTNHARMRVMYTDLVREWLTQWLVILDSTPITMEVCMTVMPPMLRVLVRLLAKCPDPSMPSAWCTATDALVRVAERGTKAVEDVPDAITFWSALFDAFATALCAEAPTMPTDEEDACTLRVLRACEQVLANANNPDSAQCALDCFFPRAMQATHLYKKRGTLTQPCIPKHRERMAYATWDMLFRLCSATSSVSAPSVAAQLMPIIVERCDSLLRAYIDDVRIRGAIPLPRVRIEETNYLLHALLTLHVAPNVYEHHAHAADAHLFALGYVLDTIATMPVGAYACAQTAHIGTSLPDLQGTVDTTQTTPQSLAAAAIKRRTSL